MTEWTYDLPEPMPEQDAGADTQAARCVLVAPPAMVQSVDKPAEDIDEVELVDWFA